jgi:hypothetical protein
MSMGVSRAWQRPFQVEALIGELKNELPQSDDYLQWCRWNEKVALSSYSLASSSFSSFFLIYEAYTIRRFPNQQILELALVGSTRRAG